MIIHIYEWTDLIQLVFRMKKKLFTSAEYGDFTDGVSWHGTMDRQWMDAHWENKYGWLLEAVWFLSSHCKAVLWPVVW